MRKSHGVEHDCAHNEVLEFIGDKVLDTPNKDIVNEGERRECVHSGPDL